MKILVNGTLLLAPMTGIGQYIRHLFGEMSAFPEVDLNLFQGLRCARGIRPPARENGAAELPLPSPGSARRMQAAYALVKRVLPRPRELRRLLEQASFAYHGRRVGAAIYHEPNFYPHPYRGPTVITVHDLSCFDLPETHPRERVEQAFRELPRAIERADHIIVISHATANAVQQRFGVAPERLTVTHLAADPRFHPRSLETLQVPLASRELQPGGYLLCVGTLEPRKNLVTLFRAYGALPAALRQRFPLVVAGMSGWHTHELEKDAARLATRGELRLLGYVPDAELPLLYAGAAAFIYPSIYEGFGLPPLEAMASGVPVLAANRTSLPEVVGDGGMLLDPYDVEAFRAAIMETLEDGALRQALVERGLRRATSFSWRRCAEETVAVYRNVAAAHGLG